MPPRRSRPRPIFTMAALALAVSRALAADEGEPAPEAVAKPSAPQATTAWEGAFGANVSYRPEYSGSSKMIGKISPAIFLRYGRFTITNASGFVTRRSDDVVRGLGIDMVRSERVRLNLALRVDQGRSEQTSDALKGMGDIKPTIRARMSASWKLEGPWRAGAAWSVDLLGKGGGGVGDVGGGWERKLTPATTLNLSAGLSFGDGRYMQSYFGISEQQATTTPYAVYRPGAGLRDVAASINLRHDFGTEWTMLAGASASRLIGHAATSPLTTSRNGWGLSTGLARRF